MLIRLHCNSFSLSTPSWRAKCSIVWRLVLRAAGCAVWSWNFSVALESEPYTCGTRVYPSCDVTLSSDRHCFLICDDQIGAVLTPRPPRHDGDVSMVTSPPARGKGQRICGTPRASDGLKFSSRAFIDSVLHVVTSVPAVGRVSEHVHDGHTGCGI